MPYEKIKNLSINILISETHQSRFRALAHAMQGMRDL